MLNKNEFVCYVSKDLTDSELDQDLNFIISKMKSFLPPSFEVDSSEQIDNIVYLTCICNNINDYEYIELRSSYTISRKPLK